MKTTRVTLIIEGRDKDVTDIIQVAIAGGVLRSMTMDEVITDGAPPTGYHQKPRKFELGDLVKATTTASRYGVIKGAEGRVTKIHRMGTKSKVEVLWNGQTEPAICGGSVLAVIAPEN